jgi:hypothetical protein
MLNHSHIFSAWWNSESVSTGGAFAHLCDCVGIISKAWRCSPLKYILRFYRGGLFLFRVDLSIAMFSFDNYLEILIVRENPLRTENFWWLIDWKRCIRSSACHLLAKIFNYLDCRRGRRSLFERPCWRRLKQDYFSVNDLFRLLCTDRKSVRDAGWLWKLSFIKQWLITRRSLSLLFFNFLNISLRKALLHPWLTTNFNHCHKKHQWRCFTKGGACFNKAHFISLGLRNWVWKISCYPRVFNCLWCMVALT